MSLKKILTALAATAVLSLTGVSAASSADDWNGHRDSQYGDYHGDRHDDRGDRYDNRGDQNYDRGDRHSDWRGHGWNHRHYVDRDRIFRTLRHRHYDRWSGDPYFHHGHYVVRSYDRFGRIVMVEVDPYTGAFIGVVRL